MKAAHVQKLLRQLGNSQVALFSQRFFKTGAGEYGEGDLFRGIRVPMLRSVAKNHKELALHETLILLRSAYHEDRLVALLILIHHFVNGSDGARAEVYRSYLKNTRFINGWDLVDASAPQIVGAYLWDKDRRVLCKLARSRNLWERRIAMLATFHFIKRGEFSDTLEIASQLLSDSEDLIHKAVGWMLREVGKQNTKVEEEFLRRHCHEMPRTMLRYAVEKFPEAKRLRYLRAEV
jgi:3-methyladenine DNA glycosylase AlkD